MPPFTKLISSYMSTVFAVLLPAGLRGCGGEGGGTVGSAGNSSTYSIGGTVSGLSGSLVLQDNGGDDLTLSADGDISSLQQPTQLPCLQGLLFPPHDIATPPEAKHTLLAKPLIDPEIANIINAADTPNSAVRENPLASLLRAKELSGLPETLVIWIRLTMKVPLMHQPSLRQG